MKAHSQLTTRIWEEVVTLGAPRLSSLVKRLDIARRCRVENVVAVRVTVRVHVADQLVHVLVVLVGVHVVEVIAKGEHEVLLVAVELKAVGNLTLKTR